MKKISIADQMKKDKKLFESGSLTENMQDQIHAKILTAVKTAIARGETGEDALDKIKNDIFDNMTEEQYEEYENTEDASKEHEFSLQLQDLIDTAEEQQTEAVDKDAGQEQKTSNKIDLDTAQKGDVVTFRCNGTAKIKGIQNHMKITYRIVFEDDGTSFDFGRDGTKAQQYSKEVVLKTPFDIVKIN